MLKYIFSQLKVKDPSDLRFIYGDLLSEIFV